MASRRLPTVELAKLWSDDMVVTNPLNKFVTKRQVLGMAQSGILTFTAYDRAIEYARVYGDTVILAGNETVTATRCPAQERRNACCSPQYG